MCGRDDDPSMIDVPTDPLAALLCDLFPTAERSRWPFSVQLAAERLRAAGVTVASPSDPAAPLREAAQAVDEWLRQTDTIGNPAIIEMNVRAFATWFDLRAVLTSAPKEDNR